MSTDLDYFREKYLDKTNIKKFYESLPGHLQSKFKASLHTDIDWGIVLQGYRGPEEMCNGGSGDSEALSPSDGMQEIRFWWGTRKDINLIPIIGWFAYGASRTAEKLRNKLNWSSLYFDSKTGECLSHDKNEAAEKLNTTRSSNYQRDDDSRQSTYREDYNNHWQRHYWEERHAFKEDREAYHTLAIRPHGYGCHCYENTAAQDEMDAMNLNSEGDLLFEQGKYSDALNKYKVAYDKSKTHAGRRKYSDNQDKARIEIQVAELIACGDCHFFCQHNSRYDEASRKTQICAQRRICHAKLVEAQSEIRAEILNFEGTDLFRHGTYSEALQKYQLAFSKSQVTAKSQLYKTNVAVAKNQIDAMQLNSQGDNLFEQGKYSQAHEKYQKAYDIAANLTVQSRVYKANQDKAKVEVDAVQFNSQGDNLFKQGKYNEAHSKFQRACNTSRVSTQIKIFKANSAKAQAEIDAINLNSQGDKLFEQGKYIEAQNKYQEAYNRSQITTEKNKYIMNKDKAQAIVNKLMTLDTLWKHAWDAEKNNQHEEAKENFQKVLSESEDNLETFPGNSKFEQYKTLAILKIEGNETFNQGLQSQLNGIILFEAGQELKHNLKNLKQAVRATSDLGLASITFRSKSI